MTANDLRCHLPGKRQGRWLASTLVRHKGDGGASGRDQPSSPPGAHAVLILNQAGWHVLAKLQVPGTIPLVFLPPCSPERNPVENVWQFVRDTWLP